MRQAGILAAAGILSLRDMSKRLDQDHKMAQRLAKGLAQLPHIDISPEKVDTNMVFFRLAENAPFTVQDVTSRLKDDFEILIGGGYGRNGFRAVTHFWIDEGKVDKTVDAMKQILN